METAHTKHNFVTNILLYVFSYSHKISITQSKFIP